MPQLPTFTQSERAQFQFILVKTDINIHKNYKKMFSILVFKYIKEFRFYNISDNKIKLHDDIHIHIYLRRNIFKKSIKNDIKKFM